MRRNRAGGSTRGMSPERRNEMIAVAAYFRAERRGFGQGDPVVDWIEAEAEIDHQLQNAQKPRRSGDGGHELVHRIEIQFRDWDQRFDDLKSQAKELKARARTAYLKDLDALQQRRMALGDTLHELGKRSGDAFEDMRHGAEHSWAELREAMEHLAQRLR